MTVPIIITYILKDGEVVEEPDARAWSEWFANVSNRVVEQTHVKDALVSTIFLGVDHGFGSDGKILFETMVFGGHYAGYQIRCSSLEKARLVHSSVCALIGESFIERVWAAVSRPIRRWLSNKESK